MAFIDWSDSEEMLGLLSEYVADERSESQADPARRVFLTDLLEQLAGLTDNLETLSGDEVIGGLRDICASRDADFFADPVIAHLEACIEELQRIEQTTRIASA
jgi:hypothetical protein